jgi:nitrite reductase (NADH) large subunit
MKYIIIGNGVAGTTAALNIREFDASGEIIVITEEDIPFYSRIRLPEYLSGSIDEKKLILHDDAWYKRNGITLITNRRVSLIEPVDRRVVLGGEDRIPYDKLLIATGGRASIPALRGADKKGVFTLRTIADARKIRTYAENAVNVMILGAGVLGLEIGNALRKTGKSVTLVEFSPRLLPKQMDETGSGILQKKLESLGLRFILSARADEVLGVASVEGLKLKDGVTVRGQIIVVSAGIIPDTSLLVNTGIALGKGVPVNDRMETELPDIYAAGDAAEHCDKIYGIWPAAEKQGEIAGINMAGGNTSYNSTIPSHSVTVAGIEVIAYGEIDVDCTLPSLVYQNKEKGIYKKIVVRDDCVAGCILCGDTTGKKEVISAVQERRQVNTMRKTLEELNIPWTQSQG